MTITLRPEHEEVIARAMQTGAYQTADEVIARALEVLRSEDEWLAANKDSLNQKIETAIEQLDRGEGIPGEDVRGRLEQRKAGWLAQNG
jgi:Arc/MetJ-type ribon-helix-helix transcriptional regulator